MTDKKCGCACICQPKYITIYKGFDTYFNGKHLIHIGVEGIYAEREHSYKFIIGGITKKYDNITDGFYVDLTAAETKTLDLGPLNGTLIAIDDQGHETPITTALPFIIENWVQGDINVEQNDITINVKDGDQNEIIINLKSPYFETVLHNDLLDRDVENCHPVGAITGLSEALEGKQNVIEDLEDIRSGAALGATSVQSVTTGTENGTVSVDGSDVAVKGLGSAAFENKTEFDAAGAASTAEQNAKNYADSLSSNYATAAQGAKADTAVQTITTGSTSGTISVDGTDVAVADIGSAAYSNSSDFATSEQGTLASSALQPTDVINDLVSTDTDKPLSANMGKSLKDQVDNLSGRGHYLALWNCATGLAQSNPPQSPYVYKAGDYFIVGTVATGSANNYRPTGTSYTTGVASTVVETQAVDTDDVYYYDGTNWSLQINTQKEVGFGNIAGSPYDNTNLASALNAKLESTDLKTINGTSLVGSGNIEIASNQLFDEGWTTDSTTVAFLEDVYADTSATIGMSYIGELQCSDLPASMGNAEATMEILPSSTAAPKVIHITLTSGTTDPYRWELTYYVIGATVYNSGWIAFQPKMSAGTGIAIASNTISAVAMTGADGTNAGTMGAVPAPASTSNKSFLRGDASWYALGLIDLAGPGSGINFATPSSPNYDVVGSPTITDGIASGFGSSSYIQKNISLTTYTTSIEFISLVKPTSFPNSHNNFLGFSASNNPIGFSSDGKIQWWLNDWYSGGTVYTAGQKVWVKLKITTSNIKVYTLLDNGYSVYSLPSGGWSEQLGTSPASNWFSGYVRLGNTWATTSQYFGGEIDLNNTTLTVDGETVWSPMTPIPGSKTTISANIASSLSASSTNNQSAGAKAVYDGLATKQETLVSGTNIKTINNQSLLGSGNIDIQGGGGGGSLTDIATAGDHITFTSNSLNFTTIGSPSVINGVASNFSVSDYLKSTSTFSPGNNTWEVIAKVTTGSNVSIEQSIFDNETDRRGFRVGLAGTTTQRWQILVSNGSAWINSSNHYGSYVVQPNTTYWIKAGFSGSRYYLYYSLDGVNYTQDVSYNSTVKVDGGLYFTIGNKWGGSVDLTEMSVSINNTVFWTPYDLSGKTIINSEPVGGFYGTCSTAISTAAKVVVCPDFVLKAGAKIDVKFDYSNWASSPTLNVNGTGAVAIKSYGTTAVSGYAWRPEEVVPFIYDGTYWYILRSVPATTTYYGPTILSSSMTNTSIAAALTPYALQQAVYNMLASYPTYSSQSTYAVGDRVLRNYNAWECNTAITTAEQWNSAHWTKLDPIQKQIDDKIGDIETLLAQV